MADHDAEDRATLDREGIKTRPAHKAVRPGIEAVSHRFASRARGRRILIHRGACATHLTLRWLRRISPSTSSRSCCNTSSTPTAKDGTR